VHGARRYVAGFLACLAWIPSAARAEWRRATPPLVDHVRCPAGGYDMKGLATLRCPECGSVFTLEELLGALRPDFRPRR